MIGKTSLAKLFFFFKPRSATNNGMRDAKATYDNRGRDENLIENDRKIIKKHRERGKRKGDATR